MGFTGAPVCFSVQQCIWQCAARVCVRKSMCVMAFIGVNFCALMALRYATYALPCPLNACASPSTHLPLHLFLFGVVVAVVVAGGSSWPLPRLLVATFSAPLTTIIAVIQSFIHSHK